MDYINFFVVLMLIVYHFELILKLHEYLVSDIYMLYSLALDVRIYLWWCLVHHIFVGQLIIL